MRHLNLLLTPLVSRINVFNFECSHIYVNMYVCFYLLQQVLRIEVLLIKFNLTLH